MRRRVSPLAGFDTEWAGLDQIGWIYWAWKYYDDPHGILGRGPRPARRQRTRPIVTVLSRTYPQEVAGDPSSILFNPFTGAFSMVYSPTPVGAGCHDH